MKHHVAKRIDMYEPVYRIALVLVIDSDFERFRGWLRDDLKYTDHLGLTAGSGYCITIDQDNSNHKGACSIIWLRNKELQVLVHELIHLTMAVFDDKGIPVRSENGEAFAYYTEYWFNRIRKEWSK